MRLLELVLNVSEENEPIEWLTIDVSDGYVSFRHDHWSNISRSRETWQDEGITFEEKYLPAVVESLISQVLSKASDDYKEQRHAAVHSLKLSPTVERALLAVGDELFEVGWEQGVASAFGIMGMIKAIRSTR